MSTIKTLVKGLAGLSVESSSFCFETTTFIPTLLADIALGRIKKGNGQPIMILPGFSATDGSLFVLVKTLNALGYNAYTWGQGRNHGRFEELRDGIISEALKIYDKHGEPLTIIGWSKGGRMALKLAEIINPNLVAGILTIGSPLWPNSGRSVEDIPDFLYKIPLRGVQNLLQDGIDILNELQEAAPMSPKDVPTTVIIGGFDQIVPEVDAVIPVEFLNENLQNCRVSFCGHLALGFSARTVRMIVQHINAGYHHYHEVHPDYVYS